MVIEKDLIVYAVVWFVIIMMMASWSGWWGWGWGGWDPEKPWNNNNEDLDRLYTKINKENRNLEWLSIKIAELENEIEVLRYEWDEDLEKADKNDLKIRKLVLKVQHLDEKIFQKKSYIQDLQNEINSLSR